jgi:hypothetical protein
MARKPGIPDYGIKKPGKPTRPGDSIMKPTPVKPGTGNKPKPMPVKPKPGGGMKPDPARQQRPIKDMPVGTDAQKRAKKLKELEAQLKKSKGGGIGGGGKKVKRATGMVKTTKTMRKGTR